MNAPLRRVAVAILVLFGALLLNVNRVQVLKAEEYREHPANSRVLLREYSQERGPILVGEGRAQIPVAASKPTPQERLKYLRTYPGGPTYAHVTGFNSLVYGHPAGIERSENDVLTGLGDEFFVSRLSDSFTGRQRAGGRVVLTINPAAQTAAAKALGGNRGSVVALDPKTGAVLAMVSSPSYDPDVLASHEPREVRAAYNRLVEADSAPLLNRAINATYPPGSTFKVITAAAALASDKYTPQTQVRAPRELDLPQTNQPLRNFGRSSCTPGDDTMTLADALKVSCNTSFGALGLELGEQALREQAQAFGFGRDDIEAPTTVAPSVIPSDLDPPSLAQSAIGQRDVRVTPLQMAMVAAGIANDGNVMRPYLVREVLAPDLKRVRGANPDVLNRAVSSDVAEELTSMMELVVSDGSATSAQIPGVRVAGKTGTAQHAEGQDPHAWFIGFAPADNPRVAVAVVVERGGNAGSEATGGRVAAPIARDVIRAVLGG